MDNKENEIEVDKAIAKTFKLSAKNFIKFCWWLFIMSAVLALPTMYLWEWIMPDIFGLTELTLVKAWGVNALSGILFKNKSFNQKETDDKNTKKNIKSLILG